MTKLQAWIMTTIALAVASVVGFSIFPPIGLGGMLITIFSALWTGAIYEEEVRL